MLCGWLAEEEAENWLTAFFLIKKIKHVKLIMQTNHNNTLQLNSASLIIL